jgi:hypothetical protein
MLLLLLLLSGVAVAMPVAVAVAAAVAVPAAVAVAVPDCALMVDDAWAWASLWVGGGRVKLGRVPGTWGDGIG